MPIDPKPGGTDIVDLSGNGNGVDIDSDPEFVFITDTGLDLLAGKVYSIDEVQVVGPQQAPISDALTDSQKITAILAALRTHGLIDT